MTDKLTLGDRMKGYENVERRFLYTRMPVIIRLDMRAGHSLTGKWFKEKPIDFKFQQLMISTADYLLKNIQNCRVAYTQSDEISLLLCDFQSFETQSWFGNNLQKIVSVSAGMASSFFTTMFQNLKSQNEVVVFDARAFNLSKEEIYNYFLWRSIDCSRNSVQAHAQSMFSHKELHSLNTNQLISKMKEEKDFNWVSQPDVVKNGAILWRDEKYHTEGLKKLSSDEGRQFWQLNIKPFYTTQE